MPIARVVLDQVQRASGLEGRVCGLHANCAHVPIVVAFVDQRFAALAFDLLVVHGHVCARREELVALPERSARHVHLEHARFARRDFLAQVVPLLVAGFVPDEVLHGAIGHLVLIRVGIVPLAYTLHLAVLQPVLRPLHLDKRALTVQFVGMAKLFARRAIPIALGSRLQRWCEAVEVVRIAAIIASDELAAFFVVAHLAQ